MKTGTNICARASYLKIALIALTLAAFFVACTTQRKCLEKFPPVNTSDTLRTIEYKDTTIFMHLPGDTIVDSIKVIVLQEPGQQKAKPQSLKVSNEYASAQAWLQDGWFKIKLILNDTAIAHKIDSAIAVTREEVINTQQHIVRERYVPWIFKAAMAVTIVLLIYFFIHAVTGKLR